MLWPFFILSWCYGIVLWLVGCGRVGCCPGVGGLFLCATGV